jgi:hypothetical protein
VVKRKIPSPSHDSNPPVIQPVAQSWTTELSQLVIIMIMIIIIITTTTTTTTIIISQLKYKKRKINTKT